MKSNSSTIDGMGIYALAGAVLFTIISIIAAFNA
jgi:hypothetical protein